MLGYSFLSPNNYYSEGWYLQQIIIGPIEWNELLLFSNQALAHAIKKKDAPRSILLIGRKLSVVYTDLKNIWFNCYDFAMTTHSAVWMEALKQLFNLFNRSFLSQ